MLRTTELLTIPRRTISPTVLTKSVGIDPRPAGCGAAKISENHTMSKKPKTYQALLRAAQLSTTRADALKILKKARKLELLEHDYQYQAFKHAVDH